MEKWYIETSAINYLNLRYSEIDALATRNLQKLGGRKWLISPVSFFELSLTKNNEKRDKLIGFAKHLLYEDMLPSVEEIIINFIQNNCPSFDNIDGLECKNQFNKIWINISNISNLSYEFNQNIIQFIAQKFRLISKVIRKIVKHNKISNYILNHIEKFQLVIKIFRKVVPNMKKRPDIPVNISNNLLNITIFLIFYFFCLNNCMFPDIFKMFWNKINIQHPIDRFKYLVNTYPKLFYSGPFVEMALAGIYQINNGISRGLFFDILHFTYLPFVNYFLTNDKHYYQNENFIWHPNIHKIMYIEEMHRTEKLFKVDYPLL